MPIGSILGGMIGAGGASAAGSAAGAAGVRAFQNGQTEEARNRANISPWTNVGSAAVSKLASLYGLGHLDNGQTDPTFGGRALDTTNVKGDQSNALTDFTTSPGYQFRLQQGVNALDRSASSRGMTLSGAQNQAVSDYGQNTASNEWDNYIKQLNTMSGAGESGVLGTDSTNSSIFNQGNALGFKGAEDQASSYANSANALASGIGKGMQNLASIVSFNPWGAFGSGGGFSKQ